MAATDVNHLRLQAQHRPLRCFLTGFGIPDSSFLPELPLLRYYLRFDTRLLGRPSTTPGARQ